MLIKIAAIIYQNYKSRQKRSPYFDTLFTIVLILFFHTVHIALLFRLPSKYIMPWDSSEARHIQWLYGILYFGIITSVIAFFFKKNKLEKVEVSDQQIKNSKIALPLYLAICIVLLILLLIKSGFEKGTL